MDFSIDPTGLLDKDVECDFSILAGFQVDPFLVDFRAGEADLDKSPAGLIGIIRYRDF